MLVEFRGEFWLSRSEQPELQEQQDPSPVLGCHSEQALRPFVSVAGGNVSQHHLKAVQPLTCMLVEQRQHEVVFVGEVGVEGAAGESGGTANVADRDLCVSTFDEQLFCAGQKYFAGVHPAAQRPPTIGADGAGEVHAVGALTVDATTVHYVLEYIMY